MKIIERKGCNKEMSEDKVEIFIACTINRTCFCSHVHECIIPFKVYISNWTCSYEQTRKTFCFMPYSSRGSYKGNLLILDGFKFTLSFSFKVDLPKIKTNILFFSQKEVHLVYYIDS